MLRRLHDQKTTIYLLLCSMQNSNLRHTAGTSEDVASTPRVVKPTPLRPNVKSFKPPLFTTPPPSSQIPEFTTRFFAATNYWPAQTIAFNSRMWHYSPINNAAALADDLCCPFCSYYFRFELFNMNTGPGGFRAMNEVVGILRKHVLECHNPSGPYQYVVRPVTYARVCDTWCSMIEVRSDST